MRLSQIPVHEPTPSSTPLEDRLQLIPAIVRIESCLVVKVKKDTFYEISLVEKPLPSKLALAFGLNYAYSYTTRVGDHLERRYKLVTTRTVNKITRVYEAFCASKRNI